MDKLYLIPESLIKDVIKRLEMVKDKNADLLVQLEEILHNKLLQNVFATDDNKEE